MILIYIYNTKNLELLISNVNIFLEKQHSLFDIIIYSNQTPTTNHNLQILSYNVDDYFFYPNVKNSTYDFIIEINDTVDLNIFLSFFVDYEKYISCNYKMINNYFNENDLKLIPNITKKKNIDLNVNSIPDSIKIYNVNNLKKINWVNTMEYIHNKCIEFDININNEKLLVLYQILYPQYIELQELKDYIEKNEDEEQKSNELTSEYKKLELYTHEYKKENIWLIKRSACKKLLNNYVVSIDNTYLKKNNVKENKNDPTDKIYVRIGKKFKLSWIQKFTFFYVVDY